MKEHIMVFDKPPTYGSEIPLLYDIQIFNVPEEIRVRIVTLLKRMGFSYIREKKKYESIDEQLSMGSSEIQTYIGAEYNIGRQKSEYDKFWHKKEMIETALDNLLGKNGL